jgi:hypothetical protein
MALTQEGAEWWANLFTQQLGEGTLAPEYQASLYTALQSGSHQQYFTEDQLSSISSGFSANTPELSADQHYQIFSSNSGSSEFQNLTAEQYGFDMNEFPDDINAWTEDDYYKWVAYTNPDFTEEQIRSGEFNLLEDGWTGSQEGVDRTFEQSRTMETNSETAALSFYGAVTDPSQLSDPQAQMEWWAIGWLSGDVDKTVAAENINAIRKAEYEAGNPEYKYHYWDEEGRRFEFENGLDKNLTYGSLDTVGEWKYDMPDATVADKIGGFVGSPVFNMLISALAMNPAGLGGFWYPIGTAVKDAYGYDIDTGDYLVSMVNYGLKEFGDQFFTKVGEVGSDAYEWANEWLTEKFPGAADWENWQYTVGDISYDAFGNEIPGSISALPHYTQQIADGSLQLTTGVLDNIQKTLGLDDNGFINYLTSEEGQWLADDLGDVANLITGSSDGGGTSTSFVGMGGENVGSGTQVFGEPETEPRRDQPTGGQTLTQEAIDWWNAVIAASESGGSTQQDTSQPTLGGIWDAQAPEPSSPTDHPDMATPPIIPQDDQTPNPGGGLWDLITGGWDQIFGDDDKEEPEPPPGDTPTDQPEPPPGDTPTDQPEPPPGDTPTDQPEPPPGDTPTDQPNPPPTGGGGDGMDDDEPNTPPDQPNPPPTDGGGDDDDDEEEPYEERDYYSSLKERFATENPLTPQDEQQRLNLNNVLMRRDNYELGRQAMADRALAGAGYGSTSSMAALGAVNDHTGNATGFSQGMLMKDLRQLAMVRDAEVYDVINARTYDVQRAGTAFNKSAVAAEIDYANKEEMRSRQARQDLGEILTFGYGMARDAGWFGGGSDPVESATTTMEGFEGAQMSSDEFWDYFN